MNNKIRLGKHTSKQKDAYAYILNSNLIKVFT